LAGAWILGTAATSGLAWAAVNRVETHITTSEGIIVSPRNVDRAVAPLAVSSATTRRVDGVTSSPVTTVGVAPTASAAPDGPGQPPPSSTSSVPPASGPPDTSAPPPTTAPATPPTTNAPPPTVIPTAGGNVAVSCPTAGTIRLEYATPNPGYVYSPVEITFEHVHVKFTKGGQSIMVEAECSHGRVEVSFEDKD
jgi:hypothetical protein